MVVKKEKLQKVKIMQNEYDLVRSMELALGESEEKIVSEAIRLYWEKNGDRIREYFERIDRGSALFKKKPENTDLKENGISD